jgi:hypothetical protein
MANFGDKWWGSGASRRKDDKYEVTYGTEEDGRVFDFDTLNDAKAKAAELKSNGRPNVKIKRLKGWWK